MSIIIDIYIHNKNQHIMIRYPTKRELVIVNK